MGSCTAQLLFYANTVVRESAKFELARLKKEEEEEEEENRFWRFGDFWRGTFPTVIHDTGVFWARKTFEDQ